MAFTLPALPYGYDALEPHIDAQTMEIHYTKHHQTYINNLNAALADAGIASVPVEQLIADLDALPEAVRNVVRNNGGGHANHSLFWTVLSPHGGQPEGPLAAAIERDLGGYAAFKDAFTKA
ncbi:MAG: superoxide dismutase, partial [Pseudomonas sp.]